MANQFAYLVASPELNFSSKLGFEKLQLGLCLFVSISPSLSLSLPVSPFSLPLFFSGDKESVRLTLHLDAVSVALLRHAQLSYYILYIDPACIAIASVAAAVR